MAPWTRPHPLRRCCPTVACLGGRPPRRQCHSTAVIYPHAGSKSSTCKNVQNDHARPGTMGQVKSMLKSAVCGPGNTSDSSDHGSDSEGDTSDHEIQYGQYRPLRDFRLVREGRCCDRTGCHNNGGPGMVQFTPLFNRHHANVIGHYHAGAHRVRYVTPKNHDFLKALH